MVRTASRNTVSWRRLRRRSIGSLGILLCRHSRVFQQRSWSSGNPK
jgi:hypothetical protein